MKSKSSKFIMFTLLAILLIFNVSHVFASSVDLSDVGVVPVYPANQDADVNGYFSVTSQDGNFNQELHVILENNGSEAITLDLEIVNAYTSAMGSIQYATSSSEDSVILDKTYELKDYIELPNEITLNPDSSTDLKFKLKMNDVKGTVLGGIAFKEKIEDSNATEDNVVSIKEEVRKVYGLVINGVQEETVLLKVDESPYVEPMPSYYTIRLPIKNESSMIIEEGIINYKVTDKNGKELFANQKDLKFAPKTQVHFSIPFEADEIVEKEDYFVSGYIKYKDSLGEHRVDFEQKFEYTGNEKQEQIEKNTGGDLSAPTVANESKRKSIVLYSVIGGGFLLLLLLLLLFLKKRKEEDDDEYYEEYEDDDEYYDYD